MKKTLVNLAKLKCPYENTVCRVCSSLSKHRGDVKVKLGRGPYAISIAILIMHACFQHPRTKYMIAPNILLFSHVFFHVVIQISVE